MSNFAPAEIAIYGEDSTLPLVILFHGRGSHEKEIIDLAPHLTQKAQYVAVRAPISEGGGFAWFANRGIGRPVAESLRETMDWFTQWLESFNTTNRPVGLVGFSGGGAFAGGLMLDHPDSYQGAAIMYATIPWDAGVEISAGLLAGKSIYVAQGESDQVIPKELQQRTWEYIVNESGATVLTHRGAEGHGITQESLAALNTWITSLNG